MLMLQASKAIFRGLHLEIDSFDKIRHGIVTVTTFSITVSVHPTV